MKILFINPPYYRCLGQAYIYLPLGICAVGAVTKSAGHETHIYNMDVPPMNSDLYKTFREENEGKDERDLILLNLESDPLEIWKELRQVINELKPDVIGLTALTPQIPTAKKIATICKEELPEVPMIFGGTHAMIRPDELIGWSTVDYVHNSEAEEDIVRIIEAINNGPDYSVLEKITGLVYKRGGKVFSNSGRTLVDVNDHPMPLRDSFVFPERLQSSNMGLILTGRGCPYKCNFCASPTLNDFKVRQVSNEKIIDEIEHVVKTYGIREFCFWEDTFILGKKKVADFSEKLKERRLDIIWRCHTRLDSLTDAVLDLMIESGCIQVTVGIETGSNEMMRYIRKNTTMEKIITKLELLKSKDIIWGANFLIGYPLEKPEDIELTREFIMTHVKHHIALNTCIPFPGTPFFDECVELGFIDDSKEIDWTLFAPQSAQSSFTKYLSKQELLDYREKILAEVEPYMTKTTGSFSPLERKEENCYE